LTGSDLLQPKCNIVYTSRFHYGVSFTVLVLQLANCAALFLHLQSLPPTF